MSYAEYGSRIFFAGVTTQPQVDQKDGFGHRLKMIESCSDIRAWSSNPIENIQYFKDTIEQRNVHSAAMIIPNMAVKGMENNNKEKDSKHLEQKLHKYKVSNIIHEPKAKLNQDHDHSGMKSGSWNVMDYVFHPLNKLIDCKRAFFGGSEIILRGVKKRRNNYSSDSNSKKHLPKRLIHKKKRKLIKNEAKLTTDISFSLSSSSCPQANIDNESLSEEPVHTSNSIILKDENLDSDKIDDDNDIDDIQLSIALSESGHSNTNEAASLIFKLEPKYEESLKAEGIELFRLREENRLLKLSLQSYESQIKVLNDNRGDVNGLQELLLRSQEELDELTNEVLKGRNIINQLKRTLEENKEECDNQKQQLNNLKHNAIEIISIKNERDSLANTLKDIRNLLENAGHYKKNLEQDIKTLIDNYNNLIILKESLQLHCSDNEAEMNKMWQIIAELEEQSESQTSTIYQLNEDIKKKTSTLNEYEGKISSLTKQCQERTDIEKSLSENESINKDCDQAFAKYFKQSLEKLNDLTNALKDAGDDVQKRKRDINELKKQMKEYIRVFKYQFKKKNKENNFFRIRYEECQKIINQQIEDIENLKKCIDKLERKIIYKMELSVSELHQEHNNLTSKIYDLTSCIHERNMKIEELEKEKANLLKQIDYTTAQLEEQNKQVEILKKMNSMFHEKLDDRKKNIESIFNALQSIQLQIEKVHLVSMKERSVPVNESHKKKINILNESSDNVIKDSIINMLSPTESFAYKLSSINDDTSMLSNELHTENSSENLSSQIKEMSDICKNMHEIEVNITEKICKQADESDEEMRDDNVQKSNNKSDIIQEEFKFLFDKKDITHQNVLKLQLHDYSGDIKSLYDSNIFSKSSDTQSLSNKSDFLNGVTLLSSEIKNIKQYIPDNKHTIPKSYDMKNKSNERFAIQEKNF